MGVYKGTSKDLSIAIDELRRKYGGGDYNLLSRNCNNFADDLLQRLLNKELPSYINRMATIGSYFSCLLPSNLTDAAPVTDNNSITSGTSNRLVSGRSTVSASSSNSQSFSGSGVKLGSSSAGTPTTNPQEIGLNVRGYLCCCYCTSSYLIVL